MLGKNSLQSLLLSLGACNQGVESNVTGMTIGELIASGAWGEKVVKETGEEIENNSVEFAHLKEEFLQSKPHTKGWRLVSYQRANNH